MTHTQRVNRAFKRLSAIALALAVAAMVSGCAKKPEPIISSGTAAPGDSGYTYKLTVDPMEFNWRAEGGNLHVKMKGPAGVWISVGFNPTKGMKDANFIIGYVENGKAVVTDQFGTDPKQHRKDTDLGGTDDVKDAAGFENANETVITFTLPLNSGDALDRPISLDSNTVVLFAAGKEKQTAQQHTFWAKAGVNLSTGAYAVNLIRKAK